MKAAAGEQSIRRICQRELNRTSQHHDTVGSCRLSHPLSTDMRTILCNPQLTHVFNYRYFRQGDKAKVNTITQNRCSVHVWSDTS